jgi:hypothetical protein
VLAIEEAFEIGRHNRATFAAALRDREPPTGSGSLLSWCTRVALPTAA